MRPSDEGLQLWPLAVAAIVVVLVMLSFNLSLHLCPDAPLAFRELPVAPNGKPNPEAANEYWHSAVTAVQWKYHFGTGLPHDPPPEFVLRTDRLARRKTADDPARQQYWNQLRQLWSHPELWQRKLELDVSWAGRAASSVRDFVVGLCGRSIT